MERCQRHIRRGVALRRGIGPGIFIRMTQGCRRRRAEEWLRGHRARGGGYRLQRSGGPVHFVAVMMDSGNMNTRAPLFSRRGGVKGEGAE